MAHRIANAFKAMQVMGISEETVKPVLKELLILYDRKWELIEEDNYRTLADTIFERQEEQVFLTEGKGWGLRTVEDLPRGAFVCEYVGEILTNIELYERNKRNRQNERHTYPVLLDSDWASEQMLKDEDALCLDATYYGNVGRFINHRCFDANLIEIPVEVETPDHHYYHVAFFTKTDVKAFEELTWDYGIDFDDHNHPIKAFQCLCPSEYCRDMKRHEKVPKQFGNCSRREEPRQSNYKRV